ncbi:MAG: DNA recombination protein RmuC [Bacteroidales bacterium]|nr:DNA recombination protein RmuC [Bacteroidales bacterium]
MSVVLLFSIGGNLVPKGIDTVSQPIINIIVFSCLAAVAIAVLVTVLIARSRRASAQREADALQNELKNKLQLSQAETASLRTSTEQQLKVKDELIAQMARNYEKNLEDIRSSHKEALKAQAESLKAELTAQTEQLLKQREAELDKRAKENFENITKNLGKDISDMKSAFEANKKTQTETSASLKSQFENAVKQLEQQTRSVGEKADHLAEAMRGQKKFQGIWGETLLLNILTGEGMVEGRDFDKEVTLRDRLGLVIENEDTSRRMRPDFILHFADNQDIAVDSKVSLAAYADYLEAKNDDERQDARRRNVEAIRNQYKNLSAKDYNSYIQPGRRMVDFVIMFVPSFPALQMAYEDDPKIWRDAYSRKVLVTSEETILPFLRMIELGWRNVEQVHNQQKIIDAAGRMIDRVADFTKYYATVGKKLEEAQKAYNDGKAKLAESGNSILVSANQVRKLGVPSKKSLPEPGDDLIMSTQFEALSTQE